MGPGVLGGPPADDAAGHGHGRGHAAVFQLFQEEPLSPRLAMAGARAAVAWARATEVTANRREKGIHPLLLCKVCDTGNRHFIGGADRAPAGGIRHTMWWVRWPG